MHWKRQHVHGDVNRVHTPKALKFWSHVQVGGPDECWPWLGATRGKNTVYGTLMFRGKHDSAHRVAWIITNGELPELPGTDYRGTCVLHRCDFGLCCNPSHLFLGTHDDNMKDKVRKGRDTNKNKTHCKRGHPRTPANLYLAKDGCSACRVCQRDRARARRGRAPVEFRMRKHVVTLRGETRGLSEWCVRLGLNYRTTYKRIAKLGWPPERALKPVRMARSTTQEGFTSC